MKEFILILTLFGLTQNSVHPQTKEQDLGNVDINESKLKNNKNIAKNKLVQIFGNTLSIKIEKTNVLANITTTTVGNKGQLKNTNKKVKAKQNHTIVKMQWKFIPQKKFELFFSKDIFLVDINNKLIKDSDFDNNIERMTKLYDSFLKHEVERPRYFEKGKPSTLKLSFEIEQKMSSNYKIRLFNSDYSLEELKSIAKIF